jgi:hypothetical protein
VKFAAGGPALARKGGALLRPPDPPYSELSFAGSAAASFGRIAGLTERESVSVPAGVLKYI